MKNANCVSIVLESADRRGKSTQTKLLTSYLQKEGFSVTLIKSPYNESVTYPLVYWMLKTGWARKLPNMFQLVQFANKVFFQTFLLPKLLKNNDYIIFDRWNVSMWAYGLPEGVNRGFTEWLMGFLAEPDFTIILDGNPHVQGSGDTYENDTRLQNDVRSLYLNWVVSHPCCVSQVDANQPVQDVFDDILLTLRNRNFLG